MVTSVLARQLILLGIALGVPVIAFFLRRTRAILLWIGFTVFVQIFDTTLVTNLPAGRIIGLLFLPAAVAGLPLLVRNRSIRYAVYSLAYLLLLGVVFGYLVPWPDVTGVRPLTLRAPGKAVVYLARMLSDFSLALFVYLHGRSSEGLRSIRNGMIAGATVTSAAGVLQSLGVPDLYVAITGLRSDLLINTIRPQGLSYEPRGLGLAAVWGFFLVLATGGKRSPRSVIAALICLAGLIVSGSFSALIVFAAGVVVAIWVGIGMAGIRRRKMIVPTVLLAAAAASVWFTGSQIRSRVAFYLDPARRVGNATATNFVDAVVFRLDVFDASAVNFLAHNPVYALTGAGAGLVCLPASLYIPPGAYSSIWNIHEGKGLDSPPTLGMLLDLSNGGVIALTLWLLQVAIAFRRTYPRRKDPPVGWSRMDWLYFGRLLRFGVVFYVVQNSVSPVWAIVLGYVFVAADLPLRTRAQTVRVVRPERQKKQLKLEAQTT